MRVAFCGGGTGGHVFPALTVAQALRARPAHEGLDLLYLGVRGKADRELVSQAGIPFRSVAAGPLRTSKLTSAATGLTKLGLGTAQAARILARFRPDVVFSTGGYGSVGVGLAARLRGTPLLLFLPDVGAGLAVRSLASFARRIAVSVPPALASVPHSKAEVTGYPVRPEFFKAEKAAARASLGLHPSLPVLLVVGGSTGAVAINQALTGWAAEFLHLGQIVHVSGRTDEARLQDWRAELPEDLRARYHLHAFLLEEMASAFAAADIGVMRAGASTLGELPAARLPAILIPGEYEAGSNQNGNAAFLDGSGAACLLPQSRIAELQTKVTELLRDQERRQAMQAALAGLARPDAADKLARLIYDVAGLGKAAA